MADISVTATAVVPGSNAAVATALAGATITAGQPVYADSNGALQLADCDSATAAARAPLGISLNGGAVGQPITYIKGGDMTMNAVLTKGARYYLSATAGGIAPEADMTGSGKDVVLLGIARSTTVLAVLNLALGITL